MTYSAVDMMAGQGHLRPLAFEIKCESVCRVSALRRRWAVWWRSGRGASWHTRASCHSWKPARPADSYFVYRSFHFDCRVNYKMSLVLKLAGVQLECDVRSAPGYVDIVSSGRTRSSCACLASGAEGLAIAIR